MAGAGYKNWATGAVLTSSDLNTYVADQVVMVFASSSARSSAVSSPTEGMVSYLKDTNAIEYYDGSSWGGIGDITSIVTAAASGLAGGATSGAVTLTLNLAGLTAAQAFGADGAGVDVTFHSATAGDNMLWDASDEKLVITGTNGQNALEVADGDVEITDALTVTGTTTTYLNVITDSGTTRTPALTDASAYILCTHGSGMTITLPQDSAVAFPTGSHIIFERNGAGTLTFAAGTGATVNSKGGTLTCADRYTTVAAVKIASNTWTIFGNIG
tara:strand:- start:7457 stop:8272 length:816 start_codon:yes stop_codon:yes gene_type:complete